MRIWVRFLAKMSVGALAVLCVGLVVGCGSDNTSGGSVKGKDPKAAQHSGSMKPQGGIQVLTGKGGTDQDKLKISQKPPDVKGMEMLPNISQEELAAKIAAERAKQDPKQIEVVPGGITREQLEAKIAAERAKQDPKQIEIVPGITRGEMEAKLAAARAKHDPKNIEVLPGVSQKEFEAKVTVNRAKQDPKAMQMLPPLKESR
jgi:hypothetical protein